MSFEVHAKKSLDTTEGTIGRNMVDKVILLWVQEEKRRDVEKGPIVLEETYHHARNVDRKVNVKTVRLMKPQTEVRNMLLQSGRELG